MVRGYEVVSDSGGLERTGGGYCRLSYTGIDRGACVHQKGGVRPNISGRKYQCVLRHVRKLLRLNLLKLLMGLIFFELFCL